MTKLLKKKPFNCVMIEQMKLEIFDPSETNRRSNTLKFGTTEKGDIPL